MSAGLPPFFVFGTAGNPEAFPVQDGFPVCITEEEFVDCCCGLRFWAGSVSGTPVFNFGVIVDPVRKFAYAIQATGEFGPVCRFDLASGRIDVLPIQAAYGLMYRQSDGLLILRNHRGSGDSILRGYYAHTWNPGDVSIPAIVVGQATDTYSEYGSYAPELDAALIAQRFAIYSWPAGTLSSPAFYRSTSPSYAVHGLRWEDGKTWWIEGDQSSGGRWSVGSTVYTTGPGWGTDIVPLPDLGRAILIGHRFSSHTTRIADAATGTILHTISGYGQSGQGGSYRANDGVVVFDNETAEIRVVDPTNGTYQSFPAEGAIRYVTGFFYDGQRMALPFSGAAWTDENCGVKVF